MKLIAKLYQHQAVQLRNQARRARFLAQRECEHGNLPRARKFARAAVSFRKLARRYSRIDTGVSI